MTAETCWGIMEKKEKVGERMTEVVAALIRDADRFLICQRPASKARGLLWEFVGGKVEPGESRQEALIRECREELAITVGVGDIFTEVTHTYPDLTIHLTVFTPKSRRGPPRSWNIMTFAGFGSMSLTGMRSARQTGRSWKSSGKRKRE